MLCAVQVRVAPVHCFAELEGEWRALEAELPALSFFQSWSWVGCLAEERYPDPVLLRAEAGGSLRGLALFNRRRGRLHLAESGDAALDAPFIEHNGPVAHAEAVAPLLRAAWTAGARRVVLNGVPPSLPDAGGGIALRWQQRVAPRLDLGAVRAAQGDWLAGLSGNARYQIRRSARAYGMPALHRAASTDQALEWLDALIRLHEATWQARGKPGAFATPFLRRFHDALIRRAAPRGELDMLRIEAGEKDIGYLYNFRVRGHVHAYQSGLDHAGAGAHHKPGLTSHALAIEHALARGDAVYDFLAGADRYKRSLANAELPLIWAEMVPRWSLPGMAARLRGVLRRG